MRPLGPAPRRTTRAPGTAAGALLLAAVVLMSCGGGPAARSEQVTASTSPAKSVAAFPIPGTMDPTAATDAHALPSTTPRPAGPASTTATPSAGRSPSPAVVRSAGRASSQTGPAVVVYRGNPNRLAVALTFDAGADRGYAEYILDVLLYLGVPASFGMTGAWAERNPDLVQRMAAEGHRLMNHTYDHGSFTGLSTRRRPLTAEQRWAQLDRTEQIIYDLTGQSTLPLFRAPYGDTDASVLRDIAARGYAYNVLWTVDSGGWQYLSAGAITQRCLRQAVPGAIYVMHVGVESQDAVALPAIIAGLRDAGYAFETVDQILE